MEIAIDYAIWLNQFTSQIYNGYIYGDQIYYLDSGSDMESLYNLFLYDYDSI